MSNYTIEYNGKSVGTIDEASHEYAARGSMINLSRRMVAMIRVHDDKTGQDKIFEGCHILSDLSFIYGRSC
jgi:hypothetical protein